MSDKNSSPTDARNQAVMIREAWANIDPAVTYGDMPWTELDGAIHALDAAENAIAKLEDQLVSARNDYWAKKKLMWQKVKQARLAAKVKHGEDSSEYERFGGTRTSERKRRRTSTPVV